MEVMMKRVLLAIGAMTMLMTGMAFAEAEIPAVDQPPANQEQRTEKAIANGQNEVEPNKPAKQQKQVNKTEDKAKANGVMTKEQRKEWEKLGTPQNRTSRINASRKHEHTGRHR
jgi:hypothetical protein